MKKLLVFILGVFMSALVFADESIDEDTKNAVLKIAQSKKSQIFTILANKTHFVYIGKFNGCDAVSILSVRRNFRICDGKITERKGKYYPWESFEHLHIRMLVDKVAQDNGAAMRQDSDGYTYISRVTDEPFAGMSNCKTLESIVSYDGDLADRMSMPICTNKESESKEEVH